MRQHATAWRQKFLQQGIHGTAIVFGNGNGSEAMNSSPPEDDVLRDTFVAVFTGPENPRAHEQEVMQDISEAFDIIIVDCFTAEGMAAAVADGSLLVHLSGCMQRGGLCVLNLHALVGDGNRDEKGDEKDEIEAEASASHKRTAPPELLALLRRSFGEWPGMWRVDQLRPRSSQNLVVVCHQIPLRDSTNWRSLIGAALAQPDLAAACPDVGVQSFVELAS